MEGVGNELAVAGGVGVSGWWATASAVQLALGIYSFRKGCAGDCRLMPVKAFGVASLFVGAGVTSAMAILTSYDIYSVKDVMEVGANIRTGLNNMGVRPRAREE